MNKKVLLTSLLASGIVATTILTGNANAATNVPEYGEKLMTAIEKSITDDAYTMAVLLPSSNPLNNTNNALTKSKVVDLLEAKYKKGIVSKIYKTDKTTEVSAYEEKVGTGYVVELTTGRKLTVVLYGDVNSDGLVDTKDAVAIAKHNVGSEKLTGYSAEAAKLTSGNTAINTSDTTRVAYYNVNGLGTDKAGKALLDMKLYPEDYTDAEETVTSDNVLQDAIDDILDKEGNSTLFDITLDSETNTAEFGLLDSTKKISDFVNTGLIDKLVDQLKNNDNLAKIELSVEGLEEGSVVLDKTADSDKCYEAALKLLNALLKKVDGSTDVKELTVDKLFGKDLKAKFYVADTSKLVDEAVKDTDKIAGTYVEYTLKFVGKVNVDNTMENVLDKVNSTETAKKLFNISFDAKTNTGTFGFLDNESYLTDFVKTGLVDALAEELTNPNITKIVLSMVKADNGNTTVTETLNYNSDKATNVTEVTKAAVELLKGALGVESPESVSQSNEDVKNKALEELKGKTVLDLAGKTLEAKIYLGENTEVYDTDVKTGTEDGKTVKYLEYKLNFLVDATSQIEKNIFEELNTHEGNEYYRVSFDKDNDHLINFDLSNSKKSTKLSEINGSGNTGLYVMAEKILNSDPENDIQTISVKYNNENYEIKATDSVKIENAVKLLDKILGTNISSTNTVTSENLKVTDQQLGDVLLSKLEGVSLEVTLGLSEKVVNESNWNATETFTVQFNFIDGIGSPAAE